MAGSRRLAVIVVTGLVGAVLQGPMAANEAHDWIDLAMEPTATSAQKVRTGTPVVCSNVLLEPGFEAGPGSAWSESSSNGWNVVHTDRPRSGSYSAWLGGDHREDADIWQITAISGAAVSATLSYWYEIDSEDYCGYDVGGLRIQGVDVPGHQFDLCGVNSTGEFLQPTAIDLLAYAGSRLEVHWFVSTDENLLSNLYVDDVVLEVCLPKAEQKIVFEDGFETGTTSMWSSATL